MSQTKCNIDIILDSIKNYSLEHKVDEKKQWENCFIKKQIDKRNTNKHFNMQDYARAMVYSMLSAGRNWDCIIKDVDIDTGLIKTIDDIFYNYDIERLLSIPDDLLKKRITMTQMGNRNINRQIPALKRNIIFLKEIVGDVNDYYEKLNNNDKSMWNLVNILANSRDNKLLQMGIPLVAEYLRNLGYDLPKPDRHVCRILSNDYLGIVDKKDPSHKDVFKAIMSISSDRWRSAAEMDYYLWAFCAEGYMNVCNIKEPKCDCCPIQYFCNKHINRE